MSRQRDTGTRGHRKEGPLPRVNVCVARGASSKSCEGRWGKPSKRSPSPSECFPVFSGLRSLRRVPTGSYVLRLTCADSEFLVVVSEGKLLQGGDPRLHSTRAGNCEAPPGEPSTRNPCGSFSVRAFQPAAPRKLFSVYALRRNVRGFCTTTQGLPREGLQYVCDTAQRAEIAGERRKLGKPPRKTSVCM